MTSPRFAPLRACPTSVGFGSHCRVLRSAVLAKTSLIAQPLGDQNAKLRAALEFHPVANGDDGVEIIEIGAAALPTPVDSRVTNNGQFL